MEEKFDVEYAKSKIEELDTEKYGHLCAGWIMLMLAIGFVGVGVYVIIQNITVGIILSMFAFGLTFPFSVLSFCESSKIKKEMEEIRNKIVKYFENKLQESWCDFMDNLDKMRERNEERRKALNVSSKPTDICSNLKFRDEVSVNRYGKLKNKSLIADFLKEKIADENFDDGSIVPVTIEMAIEKFKNYDFVLRLPYETMLKRYEEKQELLDKYAETKATKGKTNVKKTTKKR